MILLTVVSRGWTPVNATILTEDGSSELFWFPIKIPHWKFLYNGAYFADKGKCVHNMDDFNNYLLNNYNQDQIITFYKPLQKNLDRRLNVKYAELEMDPICDPSHFMLPYHAVMTCSYCLAKSFAKNYVLQSSGREVVLHNKFELYSLAYANSKPKSDKVDVFNNNAISQALEEVNVLKSKYCERPTTEGNCEDEPDGIVERTKSKEERPEGWPFGHKISTGDIIEALSEHRNQVRRSLQSELRKDLETDSHVDMEDSSIGRDRQPLDDELLNTIENSEFLDVEL